MSNIKNRAATEDDSGIAACVEAELDFWKTLCQYQQQEIAALESRVRQEQECRLATAS